MQYAILKRVAVFCFKSTSKVFLMSREIKSLNLTFLMKVLNFLRRFHRWKTENPQQRPKTLFSRFFEGELQLHVRKESQNDPKIIEKENKFWQLSDKLKNFY